MISIAGMTVQFGAHRAIDHLDAVLQAPVCGLIGPNGAGKTTLVNVLSGMVQPTAGEVLIDGVSILQMSPVQRVKFGLRRSFQTEQVVEDLSVWDNVKAVLDHVPRSHTPAVQQISQVLEYVGLVHLATTMGVTLNLFQRRMVEVAKALVGQPRLLLLDEPGAGLNEFESTSLKQALLGIHAYCGAQVLLIDHDVALIAATCTQTLVMDFGHQLALGDTQAVLVNPDVRRAYLGT